MATTSKTTRTQINRIDALIFRIEALQREVRDPRVVDLLGQAKRHMIDALKQAA